jgi:hypothetical protein
MSGTILHRIRQFCDSNGLPETTFGRRAVGDPRLVGDLRNGRTLRPRTIARVRQFMEAQS